jgi:hypothetical protein
MGRWFCIRGLKRRGALQWVCGSIRPGTRRNGPRVYEPCGSMGGMGQVMAECCRVSVRFLGVFGHCIRVIPLSIGQGRRIGHAVVCSQPLVGFIKMVNPPRCSNTMTASVNSKSSRAFGIHTAMSLALKFNDLNEPSSDSSNSEQWPESAG